MFWIKHTLPPSNHTSISIMAIIASVLIFLSNYKTSIKYFRKAIQSRDEFYEITIYHNNLHLNLIGFNDTGNSLTSPTGLPILICDAESLSPILTNTEISFTKFDCNTILSNGYINAFEPDRILINQLEIQAIIGIANNTFNTDYDILLNLNTLKNTEMEIDYV